MQLIEKKNILGGGTGFIGTRLTSLLKASGYNVRIISRMPGLDRMTWTDFEKHGLDDEFHGVVNLAGQNGLKSVVFTGN